MKYNIWYVSNLAFVQFRVVNYSINIITNRHPLFAATFGSGRSNAGSKYAPKQISPQKSVS